MNFNLQIFLSVLAALFLLSIFWYFFYNSHLKKIESNNHSRENKILATIKPEIPDINFELECPVELPNTDYDIAEAINYIQPSKDAGDLLEKMYEQARI